METLVIIALALWAPIILGCLMRLAIKVDQFNELITNVNKITFDKEQIND